jgi:hypothetical protein
MGSPYHAHFELRRQTLGMASVVVFNAVVAGSWAILGHGPIGLRITAGGVAICLVVLAIGIHRAREWARIGGIVLGAAVLVFVCFQRPDFSLEFLLMFAGTAGWLALPSTKVMFAKAREMIRRTEEIKREQGAKREAYKQHVRERSKA